VRRLLRARAVQWLLAVLVWSYLELVIATMRWRLVNIADADALFVSPAGAVALFWHGRLSAAIACRPLIRAKPRRVIISLSRDGEFIARAAELLRFPAIRGSTGRAGRAFEKGGAIAFRKAVKFIVGGGVMLITADGPRGPRAVMPLGPIQIARASSQPIVLIGVDARPSMVMASWDKARIPLPFSRGCMVVDGPHQVPSDGGREQLEAVRADMQARLNAAQAQAEAILAAGVGPTSRLARTARA
jgi:hypothetical protein